jgi:uncharacterized protein (DUF433 family)
MADTFQYGVFISHSHKDKPVVRELANRLKQDGLRVWLDEWEIQPGDMIGLKIQQGLERSRTLLMVMSAAYFASEWSTLEHHPAVRDSAIRPMPSGGSFTRYSSKIQEGVVMNQHNQDASKLLAERITIDPEICHGKPCIRGLRYPVEMILELLSSGMTTEEILGDYEDLERDDIRAALVFATRLTQVKRMQAALV